MRFSATGNGAAFIGQRRRASCIPFIRPPVGVESTENTVERFGVIEITIGSNEATGRMARTAEQHRIAKLAALTLCAAATALLGAACVTDVAGLLGRGDPSVIAAPMPANPLSVRAKVDLAIFPDASTLNWSFGDGSRVNRLPTTSGREITHVYSRSGSFTIEVFLFSANGRMVGSGTTKVTVSRAPTGGGGDANTDGTDDDSSTNDTGDDSDTNGTPSGPTRVRFQTNLGDIVLEMKTQEAPGTVANFLNYVDSGHYTGVVFHRVIPDFVIQGGAFESLGEGADPRLVERPPNGPIQGEAPNGLSNVRGTVAMALRGTDANSGTDQFFINVGSNPHLDTGPPPFTVFAVVVEGMAVVDTISLVETGDFNAQVTDGNVTQFMNVPTKDVVILSATRE